MNSSTLLITLALVCFVGIANAVTTKQAVEFVYDFDLDGSAFLERNEWDNAVASIGAAATAITFDEALNVLGKPKDSLFGSGVDEDRVEEVCNLPKHSNDILKICIEKKYTA